jgi:NitT/TauT family transport system permease protein
MAFVGVIVGEFITSQAGLGYLILFAMARVETAVIFAAITVLCVIGLAVYGAVALLERVVRRFWGIPW